MFLPPLYNPLYYLNSAMTFPCCLPLCHLLVQGSHPSGLSIWTKGAGYSISQGGMKLVFDLFPFLAVMQEMVSTTIVALHSLLSSPLVFFEPCTWPTLPFFGYFLMTRPTWTVPQDELLSTYATFPFFCFFIFFDSFPPLLPALALLLPR